MSQLTKELSKLNYLTLDSIDLSFLIGYIAYSLPSENFPNIRPILKELFDYRHQKMITSENILELMVILKYKILSSQPKKLISSIQHFVGELICDNKYLYHRYFEEKAVVVKDKEGLGIQCSICTVQIDAKSVCYLSCDHLYHKECFIEYSKEQIAKKSIPLKCPTEECQLELANQEIIQFLPKDLKDKYNDFMFDNYVEKHTIDTSWCPTPGCKAVFAFDQVLDNYRCPSCSKHYCLTCKCQMHVGITCKEYQELGDMNETDKKFMVLVKGAKYKQCPNCKFWVQKNEGCDHMTCRCKYQFCYICGGKYGACSCVGSSRIIPRPRALPIIEPMPAPVLPRYDPYEHQRPHFVPRFRPHYQQHLSDEDQDIPQLYNSISEEQRRQEEQFNRILKKIALEEELQKSKLAERGQEGMRLFKQESHRPIKRNIREEMKVQVKEEIKKEKEEEQAVKKEGPQIKKEQMINSRNLRFNYGLPKPKGQP